MFGNRQINDLIDDEEFIVRIPLKNLLKCLFFISGLGILYQLVTVVENGFNTLMAGLYTRAIKC